MVWNHQLEKRWKPLVVEFFFFRGWDPTQLCKDYSSCYNDPIEYILPYIDGVYIYIIYKDPYEL